MAENTDVSHKDILEQVQKNSVAIHSLHERLESDAARMEQINAENEPVRIFVSDFDAATRVGRGLKSFISYIVFLGGVVALIWVAVVSAIKQ